jgi:flagellin
MDVEKSAVIFNYFNSVRKNQLDTSKRFERLSSGLQINRGADDPSGLGITKTMEAVVRGNQVAVGNVQDGLKLLQVQDAGLQQVNGLLQRMRDLAVRGANDATLSDADREKISNEMSSISEQITNLATNTIFQGQKPLLGTPMKSSADLEIELEWNTVADLDLHVFEPGALPIGAAPGPGQHIYYNNTNVGMPSGGQLDKDDNNGILPGYYFGLNDFTRIPVNVPTVPAQEHYISDPGQAYTGTYTIAIDRWVGYEPTYQNVDTNYTLRVYRWRGTPFEDVTVFNGLIPRDNNPIPTTTGPYWDPFLGVRTETHYTTSPLEDWNDAGSGDENVPGKDDPMSDFDAIQTINWAPITFPAPENVQAGAFNISADRIPVTFFDCRASVLGVGGLDVSTSDRAQTAISSIDTAMKSVADYLNTSGSTANDFNHIINDLNAQIINVSAARSNIEDADMASEIVKFTQDQIIDGLSGQTAAQLHAEDRISLKILDVALGREKSV